jgi:shikimate dehydrogenase
VTRPVPPKTFILIGHPVGHSLSPAIHHAAYAELGLSNHRYVVVDCPDESAVQAQFDALRSGSLAGANVTVPWKRLALGLADEVDSSARDTGAANVLRPLPVEGNAGKSRIVAYNTDVPALSAELRRGRPDARAAMILGNGGAALGAVSACRALGVARLFVTARKWQGERSPDWHRADEFEALGAVPVAWPREGETESSSRDSSGASPYRDAVVASDVIVQSTSDGMQGASDGSSVARAVPWAALKPGTFAYDVVYNPAETPFIRSARAHGLTAESGLGMLVGQAALAIELWLGRAPPLMDPLADAARRALAEKTRA